MIVCDSLLERLILSGGAHKERVGEGDVQKTVGRGMDQTF